MIVGKYFIGDTVDPLARMQHDVYHDALQIIQGQAIRQVEFALTVLGTDDPSVAPKLGVEEGDLVFAFNTHRTRVKGIGVLRVDHRTLQDLHDLLAAAWRFRVMPPQGSLFDPPLAVGEENNQMAEMVAQRTRQLDHGAMDGTIAPDDTGQPERASGIHGREPPLPGDY